jgi:hypothetical protein
MLATGIYDQFQCQADEVEVFVKFRQMVLREIPTKHLELVRDRSNHRSARTIRPTHREAAVHARAGPRPVGLGRYELKRWYRRRGPGRSRQRLRGFLPLAATFLLFTAPAQARVVPSDLVVHQRLLSA